MTFQKGISGNPSGRPAMAKPVREAIKSNGELGVNRMQQLLSDDSAWGQTGWMKPREQIVLATAAQERAYGKIENHRHGGSIELEAKRISMSEQLNRLAHRLPERISQRSAVDADVLEIEEAK
jgi:hypothetical protein